MKSRRVTFRVSFIRPEGATLAHAEAYVWDAISTMCGCYKPPQDDPNEDFDPMFDLDRDSIKIRRILK